MNQRAIARAIVSYEGVGLIIAQLPRPNGDRYASITCDEIVEEYQLDWGNYATTDGRAYDDFGFGWATNTGQPRALQVIRNELNRQFKEGILNKVQTLDGKVLRRGRNVVYVDASAAALQLAELRPLRYGQVPKPSAGYVSQAFTNMFLGGITY